MKTQSIIALAAGCACASSALADINLHLVGSTAFRSVTIVAVKDTYTKNHGSFTQTGTDGAAYETFTGTMNDLFGTTTVNVFLGWDGSTEGIQSLQGSTPSTVPDHPFITTGGVSFNAKSDISMADSFQSSTDYQTTTLDYVQVGIQPFVFAKGNNSAAGLVNVANQQLQQLFANGSEQLALFTGNAADTSKVYLTGRYPGSGTRLETTADTLYGIGGALVQYKWDATHSPNHVVSDPVGFSSGGNVRDNMNLWTATDNGKAVSVIGYLGVSDASGLTGQPANWLTYNGVKYTAGAVRNGSYSFWSYESVMYRDDASSDVINYVTDVSHGLAKYIQDEVAAIAPNGDTDQPKAIALGSMNVSRSTDGSPIAH
jgi:hypothetical protein